MLGVRFQAVGVGFWLLIDGVDPSHGSGWALGWEWVGFGIVWLWCVVSCRGVLMSLFLGSADGVFYPNGWRTFLVDVLLFCRRHDV